MDLMNVRIGVQSSAPTSADPLRPATRPRGEAALADLANFAAYCVSREFPFSYYSCHPCVHKPACVSGLHHKPTQVCTRTYLRVN